MFILSWHFDGSEQVSQMASSLHDTTDRGYTKAVFGAKSVSLVHTSTAAFQKSFKRTTVRVCLGMCCL